MQVQNLNLTILLYLSLKYWSNMASSVIRDFHAVIAQVPEIKLYVENQLKILYIPEEIIQDMILATDEAVTNIVMHAYSDLSDSDAGRILKVQVRTRRNIVEILLKDAGRPFDLKHAPAPDVLKNLNGERRGGFGVFLMKTLTDRIHYFNGDGWNCIALFKKCSGLQRS